MSDHGVGFLPLPTFSEEKKWHSGFCSCDPIYCQYFWCTAFCPCFAISQECAYVEALTGEIQHQSARMEVLDNSACKRNCDQKAWCAMCLFMCFTPLFCLLPCHARCTYRNNKHIPGSLCEDFFSSWCCPCCDIAQVMNDIAKKQDIRKTQAQGTIAPNINGDQESRFFMPLDTEPLLTNRL